MHGTVRSGMPCFLLRVLSASEGMHCDPVYLLRLVCCCAGIRTIWRCRKLFCSQGCYPRPHVCWGNHSRTVCHIAVLHAASAVRVLYWSTRSMWRARLRKATRRVEHEVQDIRVLREAAVVRVQSAEYCLRGLGEALPAT